MAMTTVHLLLTLMLRALNLIAYLALVRGLLLASNDAVVVDSLAGLSLLFLDRSTSIVAINVLRSTGPRVAQSALNLTLRIKCILLVDNLDLLASLLLKSTLDRVVSLHHIFDRVHALAVLQSIQQRVETFFENRCDATDDSGALLLILDRWNHACDEVDLLLHRL